MKLKILTVLTVLFLSSCKDENLAPTAPINDMVSTGAVKTKSGMFMNGPYGSVAGNAHVYVNLNGPLDMALEGFNTSNGPDLYVYLSKEIMPVNFISLGALKSTSGNQIYEVPGVPDLNEYKYVCIHCKQYNHLFGYALLK